MSQRKKRRIAAAIFLTLAVILIAGAYLAYRIYDYISASEAYAKLNRSAVCHITFDGENKPTDGTADSSSCSQNPDAITGRNGIGTNGKTGSQSSYLKDPCSSARHLSDKSDADTASMDVASPVTMPIVNWNELNDSGKDIVAWIEIPAIGVGYPVVHGDDNEYYLHHLPDGQYKNAGSIFMETANSPDFTDANTILYGHNMENGSMFGRFRNMSGEEYAQNPYIWICTRNRTNLYKMCSLHISSVGDESYTLFKGSVEGAKKVHDWILSENARSYVPMPIPADHEDRILTLSTCASFSEERRVLQGILIGQYEQKVCERPP